MTYARAPGPVHLEHQPQWERSRSDLRMHPSRAGGERATRGWGYGWLPSLAWGSQILRALPAHSPPSRPPLLTLSRSMLPLLTVENRACSPPPPPPLRLAVSPEILPEGGRVCCGSVSPWGRACGESGWFGHCFRLGKREGGPANPNHHLAQGEGKGPASPHLGMAVRHRELSAGEGCS